LQNVEEVLAAGRKQLSSMAPAGGAAAPAAAAAAGGKPAAAAKAPEPEPEEEADEVRLAPPSARKACCLRVRTSTVHVSAIRVDRTPRYQSRL
jgi:hypothetical protein